MSDEIPPEAPKWFTIKEAAAYLNIGEQTLYRWMRDNRITFRKVGDSTRFLREDLDAMIDVHFSDKDMDRARQVCPACHHRGLVDGAVQSTGNIHFRPKKSKFWTWRDGNVAVQSRMCPRCGSIVSFGDVQQLKSLQVEKDR